jgi:hypothetical protein
MLSFFRKKKTQALNPELLLSGLENDLTYEQKAATMASLLAIATTNFTQEINKDESTFLDKVSLLLKIEPQKDDAVGQILKKDGKYIVQILTRLTESQKDWYVGTAHSLLHIKSTPQQSKRKFAFGIFAGIGVDGKRYTNVLNLMQELNKKG